ncbi:hypothetical protein V7S43_015866 [Phytophthora oleae]|uniref:Uncharacterized protein n=1 Tax=Phytophthora oleae TaxID=2107226 RepID=A0ABD3EXW1_9STRA
MKVMASAHRRLREQVESQGGLAMIEAAAAQNKCDELKREWLFNCDFWYHELNKALDSADEVEQRMKAEIQNLQAHYQDHIDALEAKKVDVKARVSDAETQVRLLNSRPVE